MKQDKALLVVSFGTTYPETREHTIGAIETALALAFSDRTFYRAWTSGFIRRKIRAATGEVIESVPEALTRMASDGVTDVLVQPTHLLVGEEYDKLRGELMNARHLFSAVSVGRPLLAEEADIDALAELLPSLCPQVAAEDMAIWMGHGSSSLRMPVYVILNDRLTENGSDNHAVGTVEFDPGFDDVLERVKQRRPRRAVLLPLMVVAGDHAVNDMAGDGPDSWRSRLICAGVDVECVFKGLGEYEAIRALYIDHAREAEEL
ncbi:MAG: sirohydrochlorin cobaltochelatase [Oscillospiraceae bacterium]|nr:sirohydrochlorin cobaltochelatase [Oscillospiraceae bacterium]